MTVQYYDVTVTFSGETSTNTYPSRSKHGAKKKAFEDICDVMEITEETFDNISKVSVCEKPPNTQYKYVKSYYKVSPEVGQEFRYRCMDEEYLATVVAPRHEDVAGVFIMRHDQDHTMRIHPFAFRDAMRNLENI